jgi:predicted AAA+ superfamily ATPase
MLGFMNITGAVQGRLADLAGLSVFSGLRNQPLLEAFGGLLEALLPEGAGASQNLFELCRRWAALVEAFACYAPEASFYGALAALTAAADNPFARAAECHGERIPPPLRAAAKNDLERLGRIAAFDISRLGFYIAGMVRDKGLGETAGNIEDEARTFWTAEGKSAESGAEGGIFTAGNWGRALPDLAAHIRAHGAGEMGRYRSFFWTGGGFLPVGHPDPVSLEDLSGYEDQRSLVAANTLRFLEGKPANNLLLYGDRGTGKSATVKAVCNACADRGLRLLELRKNDLFELPRILDAVASRGLRFIMFIDDLSFEIIDDSFTLLKALLEGGSELRPSNAVIYATSNRRHLIKERLSDRPGPMAGADPDGELRAFDTMQEQFSLADRFGVTVIYTAPNQEEYLAIAEFIARRRGLIGSSAAPGSSAALELFRENALRWERWFNGRSPRTAVQYVDWIEGGADFPWE